MDRIAFEDVLDRHGDEWDAIVSNSGATIMDLDIASTKDWNATLYQSHLQSAGGLCYADICDGNLLGLYPIFETSVWSSGFRCKRLEPIWQHYAGRNGFIAHDIEQFAHRLFSKLHEESNWDQLTVTVTSESAHEDALLKAIDEFGFSSHIIVEQQSPYIEFLPDWDEFVATLSKKFRWLLRNAPNKFSELGELTYQEYRHENQAEAFLHCVKQVEVGSWKEAAGTSITTNLNQEQFYDRFVPLAAKNGWLSGHVLFLDGEPIAYILGFEFNGVFTDLKESYITKHRNLSPGHTLKTFAFPKLLERGIHSYDFCGNCDPYKMKWTKKSYRRKVYLISNNTTPARLAHISSTLRKKLSSLFAGKLAGKQA